MSESSNALIAERIAEQHAAEFLENELGDTIFIGAIIEDVISERAAVIYQAVDDPQYFGAAMYNNKVAQIAINTRQPLRLRYYSTAHELWHILALSGKIPEAKADGFDKERAADHFAAALMLPETLVKRSWQASKAKGLSTDRAIIRLADLAAIPYVAVVRRLTETGIAKLPKAIQAHTEADWLLARKKAGLLRSPLDAPDVQIAFPKYTALVQEKLRENKLTLDEAASTLTHADPATATILQERQRRELAELVDDDD